MKKRMKFYVVFMAVLLSVMALPESIGASVRVTASAKMSGTGGAVKVRKAVYDIDDGQPQIEIDFAQRVSWKAGAAVKSVKDNKGVQYKAVLLDRDDDECEISIPKLKAGRTYAIKISGVKKAGAGSYRTMAVTVKIPAASQALKVKHVSADMDDGEYEVEFEFNKAVQHKNAYIIISDASGKTYSSKNSYIDWEGDECTLYLSESLKYGTKYSYKIVNVKAAGTSDYTVLKGNFIAGK